MSHMKRGGGIHHRQRCCLKDVFDQTDISTLNTCFSAFGGLGCHREVGGGGSPGGALMWKSWQGASHAQCRTASRHCLFLILGAPFHQLNFLFSQTWCTENQWGAWVADGSLRKKSSKWWTKKRFLPNHDCWRIGKAAQETFKLWARTCQRTRISDKSEDFFFNLQKNQWHLPKRSLLHHWFVRDVLCCSFLEERQRQATKQLNHLRLPLPGGCTCTATLEVAKLCWWTCSSTPAVYSRSIEFTFTNLCWTFTKVSRIFRNKYRMFCG